MTRIHIRRERPVTRTLSRDADDLVQMDDSIELIEGSFRGVSDLRTFSESTLLSAPGQFTPNIGSAIVHANGERPFNASPETGWTNGFGTISIRNGTTYTPGGGVTAPGVGPRSVNNIGEILFNPGMTPGNAPASTTLSNVSASNWKRIYLAIWFKISSNWVGHASTVNKIWFVGIGSADTAANRCVLSATGSGNSTLRFQYRFQNMAVGTTFPVLSRNVGPNNSEVCTRGQWFRVESLLICNTPGVADGEAHMWVTPYTAGVAGTTNKTHQYTNLGYVGSGESNTVWRSPRWEPTYGGTGGSAPPANQYQWMDHITIAGATV